MSSEFFGLIELIGPIAEFIATTLAGALSSS